MLMRMINFDFWEEYTVYSHGRVWPAVLQYSTPARTSPSCDTCGVGSCLARPTPARQDKTGPGVSWEDCPSEVGSQWCALLDRTTSSPHRPQTEVSLGQWGSQVSSWHLNNSFSTAVIGPIMIIIILGGHLMFKCKEIRANVFTILFNEQWVPRSWIETGNNSSCCILNISPNIVLFLIIEPNSHQKLLA